MEGEQHCKFFNDCAGSMFNSDESTCFLLNNSSGSSINSSSILSSESREFFLLSNVHHPSVGGGLATTSQLSEEVLLTHQLSDSTYPRYQQNIAPASSSSSSPQQQQLSYVNSGSVKNVQHCHSLSDIDARPSSPLAFVINDRESPILRKFVKQRHESSYSLFDRIADVVLEMRKCSENVVESYPHDEGLVDFVQTTSNFAQLVQSAVEELHSMTQELNAKMANQTTVVNGMLLRRGGGSSVGVVLSSDASYSAGTAGTADKIVFNLSRCDHGRQTIYDTSETSEFKQGLLTSKTVDLVKIFEEYFKVGTAPTWQNVEELATVLTEFVLKTIYSEQTEKWTYCVRYSSRNGHKTVPHDLIEEIKTQIAKGFGVYGSTTDSHFNLAIGTAVVNKATRFFNAKRRVSTRATLRKLASHYTNGQNSADTASSKSCSSIDIDQEQSGEKAVNPSIAETIDAVINNLTTKSDMSNGEVKPKRCRRNDSVTQAFLTDKATRGWS